MNKKHLLTPDELLGLKELKQRRKVSSADAPLLNGILGRMNPGYTICETCLETMRAEATGLIAFAEKQTGKPLSEYEADKRTPAGNKDKSKTTDPPAVKTKEVTFLRVIEGVETEITANVPVELNDFESIEITEEMIVSMKPVEEKKDGLLNDDLKEAIESKESLTLDEVKALSNADLIAYVEKQTEIELAENDNRLELLSDALDLLGLVDIEPAPAATEPAAKIVLPRNGFSALKNAEIYAYVKQEKNIDLKAGMKRPELLKAASAALDESK